MAYNINHLMTVGHMKTIYDKIKEDQSDLKSAINEAISETPHDLFDYHQSRTNNGVTFTWDDEKKSYHVTGRSTGLSTANILNTFWGMGTIFPDTIKPGEKYWVEIDRDVDAFIYVAIFVDGHESTVPADFMIELYSSSFVEIPANATDIMIRIHSRNGSTDMDGYLSVKLYGSGYSNRYLSDALDADGYLESTNDATERTDEIMMRLNKYGICTLGAGVFYVNALDMPDDTTLCGQGAASKIVLIGGDSHTGTAILMHKRCTVRDLTIAGNLEDHTDPSAVYPSNLEYVFRNGIAYVGSVGNRPERAIISNVNICNFLGNGVYFNNTSGMVPCGMSMTNCSVWYCYNGLNIKYVSEFNKIANCNFTACHHGVINNGGNNMFVNCVFAKDIVGMFIDNSDGQAENNAHGSIMNSVFAHVDGNTGIGIKMIGVTPGQIVSGCTFGYAGIYLENCNGVSFTGLNAMWGPNHAGETITVIGGSLIKFSDCVFRQIPNINITNNDTVIFDHCCDYEGVEFDRNGVVPDRLAPLEVNVNRYNAHDILMSVGDFTGRTHNGITFAWNDEHTVCSINGTGTTIGWVNLFSKLRELPSGMVAGHTYQIKAKTTTNNAFLAIQAFFNNSESGAQSLVPFRTDGTYRIPDDATGLNIRVHAYGNVEFDNAKVYDVGILEDLTNAELGEAVEQAETRLMHGTAWSNSFDYLNYSASYVDRTHNGITFAWSADKKSCAAVGTATSSTPRTNMYNDWFDLPKGMEAGKTYRVTVETTDQNLYLVVSAYKNHSSAQTYNLQAFKQNGTYTVPADATGLLVSIITYSGVTVNGTIKNIGILDGVTTVELSKELAVLEETSRNEKTYGQDFLRLYGVFEDKTESGLTVAWDENHCLWLNGTSSARVDIPILSGALPAGMNPGDKFIMYFETEYASNLGVSLKFYDASETVFQTLSYDGTNFPFTVPENAATVEFGFYILGNRTMTNYPIRALKMVKLTPRKLDYPLIVSFVDDDTSSDALVTKFHDACCHNGVKGNYAVLVKRIEDGLTSQSKLLQYEDEGFGMCIHAYNQSDSATTPEWNASVPRTEAMTNACRGNVAKGIRKMREMGFLNCEYWITPGGHRESDLRAVAQQLGVKCMISTNNYRANSPMDIDRWMIRRVSLQGYDDWDAGSMSFVKRMINETVAAGGGWLIITTHFNDASWNNQTWDTTLDANGYPIGYTRVNEAFQYALNAGMVPMTIPQAWEYYGPLMEANRNECDKANV